MAIIVILIIVAAGCVYAVYTCGDGAYGDRLPGKLQTNASYIAGLYSNFDLSDSLQVFRYVFSRLDDEVTVYPSEGYFYFQFPLRGKVLAGAIMLFTPQIDSGIVEFGYAVRVEDKTGGGRVPKSGGGAQFTKGMGLEVVPVDSNSYQLRFEGKSVLFRMFVDRPHPPAKARLMADEMPVGPSFDESGLRFYLLYNTSEHALYWILNEDGFVPEDFNVVDTLLLMGQRTGFVFYADTANKRKILVGVDGYNVQANNWFDGPFDQMPDRLVRSGAIAVKPFLDTAYRLMPEQIDRYGNFRRVTTSRIPVAPYSLYYSRRDLAFVDSCRALGLPPSRFYRAITRQRSDSPPRDWTPPM